MHTVNYMRTYSENKATTEKKNELRQINEIKRNDAFQTAYVETKQNKTKITNKNKTKKKKKN